MSEFAAVIAGANSAERTKGLYSVDGGNGPSYYVPVKLIM